MNYIEIIIVVLSVIGILYSGIQIGKRFGSLEDFILTLLGKDITTQCVFTDDGNMRVYKGTKLLYELDLSTNELMT